ncbi:MAG: hypothetical protein KBT36_07495 [Kurthia sp.]|nr:hypothetical protein [Candidatus Kurthia equi]
MFYFVRTQKFLIFILFILELNLYNVAIEKDQRNLVISSIFYIVIGLTLLLFILNFKFFIEKEQLKYQFTLFGLTWYTKVITASAIARIEMKEVPDNRIAIYFKKGRGFVINDYKMRHIDDDLADFAERNGIHFKDTRPMYLQKKK